MEGSEQVVFEKVILEEAISVKVIRIEVTPVEVIPLEIIYCGLSCWRFSHSRPSIENGGLKMDSDAIARAFPPSRELVA